MKDLHSLLTVCSTRHSHLCPRQVLGVRMGLVAAALLGIQVPRNDKALLVIVETDGCFADGIEVSTGVSIGHRTLRVEDYGKVAATFINVNSGQAMRLAPRLDVRQQARVYAPAENRHYFAQLAGYQLMPDEELFSAMPVALIPTIEQIVSRAGVRTNCSVCGEEIINEREIVKDGIIYCQSCYRPGYYRAESSGMDLLSTHSLKALPHSPTSPAVETILALHEF